MLAVLEDLADVEVHVRGLGLEVGRAQVGQPRVQIAQRVERVRDRVGGVRIAAAGDGGRVGLAERGGDQLGRGSVGAGARRRRCAG